MTRPNRPKRRSPKKQGAVLAVQKQILASSKAQEIKPIQIVPDVPRVAIKRLKCHTVPIKYEFIATAQFSVISFDLSLAPDAPSYAQVFDQFRVAQISVDFYLGGGTGMTIATAIDYTDAVVPTSLLQVSQYETALVSSGTFFNRTYAPKYSVLSSTGGGSEPSILSSAWLPCQVGASTSPILNATNWLGLKLAYAGTPMTGAYIVLVSVILNFRSTN
jgi:hypothetical protein